MAPGDLAYIDVVSFESTTKINAPSSTSIQQSFIPSDKLKTTLDEPSGTSTGFLGEDKYVFPVRAKISIVYALYDSYGNVIGPYGGTTAEDFQEWQRFFELRYTPEYVQTFLSFKHEDDRNEVKVETERFQNANLGHQFVTHFTVFQKGTVVIQSPLFKGPISHI